MITNKIVSVLLTITSIVVIPVQLVTTFILGIFVTLTFGLLLLPISGIWIVLFLGPLFGLSYLWEKVAVIRPLISLLGIPLAVMGDIYVAITPSMGEMEGRFEKMIICQTFPLTWKYFQFQRNKLNIKENDDLAKILRHVSGAESINKYLDSLRADVSSRPDYVTGKYKVNW